MSKWREFWIIESENYNNPPYLDHHKAFHCHQQMFDNIHVIEYVAYEELKAEVERLTEKNKLLVEALEKITKKRGFCIYGTMEPLETTDQAYRLGSYQAWTETANIAEEALRENGGEGV